MSPSDNDFHDEEPAAFDDKPLEQPPKIKRSWTTKKKLILALSIFSAVAVLATTGLVIWTNSNTKPTNSIAEPVANVFPDESNLLVKNDDIYSNNPIELIDDILLSGLKDTTVQDKINSAISDARDCRFDANFANVVSIGCWFNDNSDAHFNFRLDNGDELRLEDLFTAGANLNQVVTNAYYDTFVSNYLNLICINEQELDCHMGGTYVPDYPADIEELALAAVLSFQQQENHDFYFTASRLYILVDGEWLNLRFEHHPEQLAIYKRFLSGANLYSTQPILPDLGFVFQYATSNILGMQADNVFVDCAYYGHDLVSYDTWKVNDMWKADDMRRTIDVFVKDRLSNAIKEASQNANLITVIGCRGEFTAAGVYQRPEDVIEFSYVTSSMATDDFWDKHYPAMIDWIRGDHASVEQPAGYFAYKAPGVYRSVYYSYYYIKENGFWIEHEGSYNDSEYKPDLDQVVQEPTDTAEDIPNEDPSTENPDEPSGM